MSVVEQIHRLLAGLKVPTDELVSKTRMKCHPHVNWEKEKDQTSGLTPYFIGSIVSILFFQPPIAVAAIASLCTGDYAAAIIGVGFGKHKLVGSKSLEGSLGCFVASLMTNALVIVAVATDLDPSDVLGLATAGAFCCTVGELFSSDVWMLDDNFVVPVTGAIGMFVCAVLQGANLSFSSF
ncbi:hypothetical protein KIPB_002769 [Kipferlia bialata]|uniref:Phosphatidate cytidylyltransferase n=1 Tax=Kipferlia bialata TaxID=797122 RepID=A0A9K3CSU7_9EUKA|nr:hypothetical protein KIPB_002769 [Kipferlia bialata]|eukprot:g2769.t1